MKVVIRNILGFLRSLNFSVYLVKPKRFLRNFSVMVKYFRIRRKHLCKPLLCKSVSAVQRKCMTTAFLKKIFWFKHIINLKRCFHENWSIDLCLQLLTVTLSLCSSSYFSKPSFSFVIITKKCFWLKYSFEVTDFVFA